MKHLAATSIIRISTILGCLICCNALAQNAPSPIPGGTSATTRAIVVGVSRYPRLPGGQQLQFAERDATAFAEQLRSSGVTPANIRLLTGADATAAAIKSAIGNWAAASAAESDTLIIFFSGHGLMERPFGEAYLLGCDSDPKNPYGTALSVSELQLALQKRVKASNVLVIADAMRRDFFDPEVEPLAASDFAKQFLQLSTSRSGIAALLGNSAGEFSREGQRWDGHGAFTKHLIDSLSALTNPDGRITAAGLFERVSALLAQDTAGKQRVWRSDAPMTALWLPVAAGASGEVAASRRPAPSATDSASASRAPASRAPQTSDSQPSRSSTPPSRSQTEAADSRSGSEPSSTEPPSTTSARKSDARVAAPAGPEASVTPPPRNAPRQGAVTQVPSSPTQPLTTQPTSPASAKPETTRTPPPDLGAATRQPPASPRPSPSTTPSTTPGATREERPLPPRSVSPPPATEIARSEIRDSGPPVPNPPTAGGGDPPPRPTLVAPSAGAAVGEASGAAPPRVTAPVPGRVTDAAPPTPLILQFDVALRAGSIVEPRGSSAWDIYQKLAADPANAGEAARLKPLLAAAMLKTGRALATSDVRTDNVADKIEDFKRAGQILSRARSLGAAEDIAVLEKLSAAEALIGLQFYDEAELALNQLQSAKSAAVENALGLIYHGKLEGVRAERAFKRAIEMEPALAAPHYNLAMVYRAAQNEAAVAELEQAAALDPSNASLAAALGDELFSRQKWQEAAAAFRKALAVKPADDTLHTKLGHALFSQGLTEEANVEYRKASELRRKQ